MGVVQSSQGNQQPASEHLLSEPAIVARLAQAVLGDRGGVPWQWLADDYDRIRDLIARVVPGFDQYNERVRRPGGFYLPNQPRQGRFPTKSGKANFTVHPLPDNRVEPGQLVMTTIRSHDQFNTTIYGLDDRYRGIHNQRRVVFMNGDDIRDPGPCGRPGGRFDQLLSADKPALPGISWSCPTTFPDVVRQPIFPRPTSWCRWTALRKRATRRLRSMLSSG